VQHIVDKTATRLLICLSSKHLPSSSLPFGGTELHHRGWIRHAQLIRSFPDGEAAQQPKLGMRLKWLAAAPQSRRARRCVAVGRGDQRPAAAASSSAASVFCRVVRRQWSARTCARRLDQISANVVNMERAGEVS